MIRRRNTTALVALSEHIVRGRWADAREPNEEEMVQTTVLSMPIEEVSAKIRTGPPLDDEEDYALPIWAGVVPLKFVAGEPLKDPQLSAEIPVPDYAAHYKRHRLYFLIASNNTRPVALVGAVMRSTADNVGAMSAGEAGSR